MTPTTHSNEQDRVTRARDGDRDAVGALWDTYTPKLYGWLVVAVRDRDLAEDLLQRTWLRAVAALPTYEHRGVSFGAWLFAIARNECRQEWRRTGREVPIEHAEELPAPNATRTDAIEVERILAALSNDDRELLTLRYIADFPVTEIARVLGISATAASVRLYRALARARKHV